MKNYERSFIKAFFRRYLDMDSIKDLWREVTAYLNDTLNSVAYDVWISKLSPAYYHDGKFYLVAPSDFHADIINKSYLDKISGAFDTVVGMSSPIIVCTEEELPKAIEEKASSKEVYTFDNYIIGQSNKFAHAASLAVAQNPGQAYNPLFIYGDSGLGKTHLLYAIIEYIGSHFPEKNIAYVKGDDFTNDLVTSLGGNSMADFRRRYRTIDVLLIDDIQFIGGKESTQEEIFHTFNALYQDKKQIVITSDRPPKEINSLQDRLRTRFEWGLLADIQQPDFETRVAIIKRKAESFNLNIDNQVAEFIATKIKTNVRQLEGTVQKINAYHRLNGDKITINLAQNAIRDIMSDNEPTPITVEKIISEVARTFEVSAEDIKSKKRMQTISNARQAAIYIVREITQMSLESIGETFGGRDHSTVVYAIGKIEKDMKSNPTYKAMIMDIIKNLKSD